MARLQQDREGMDGRWFAWNANAARRLDLIASEVSGHHPPCRSPTVPLLVCKVAV